AVSASAGEPYREKLLALPQFLTKQRSGPVTAQDINLGFALTGYFIEKHLLLPKGQTLPASRMRLVAQLVT
nr:DNA repair protein RecO [Hyphomicrobium sp.]